MNFPFDKNGIYLLACSYGPDSMALLNMLVEEGYKPLVCHVNYHHRPESNLEQSGLEQYCLEHGLDLDVLDTEGLQPTGNFQAWAREIRYQFFKERYEESRADGLLVAHQEDDHIETYLFQKSRKTRLFYYGLPMKANVFGMNIYRPMLHFSKESLKRYCMENSVPFSIDSSNLTDHYQRNRIRHAIVEKMVPHERDVLLSEIENLNTQNRLILDSLEREFSPFEQIPLEKVNRLPADAFIFLLYLMLKTKKHALPLSFDRVRQVKDICLSEQPHGRVPLGARLWFERNYDKLTLKTSSGILIYSFLLKEPGPIDCPYFKVDFSEGFLKTNIPAEAYPLTIRPALPGDHICVGPITKRINRLYIDWKLPRDLRKIWPVVADKNNMPIYIPRFQKDATKPPQSNFEIKEPFDYV